ncbi:D-2-hydroxyacid dehydrogenase [Alcanivorax sp. JB21]|uniref:D-2-hydroxyacid dehydrogenase n=1 Tax=Alcanivorax limicola TaxID=2874102 RepID=UPI001CBB0009|nr:D-2-hydroxyacid dehydrogenase [Alcanivorax limicola]MBZ2190396.1 D-2-hydroxyacid dehydrogenase [Alcanivorax limicola]
MRGVFLDTATLATHAGAADELDFSGLRDALTGADDSLPEWRFHDQTTAAQTAERIVDADVVVTNKVVLDAALIAGAPRLKLICVSATGTNNVDSEAAAARGIPVRNVPDYAGASLAQHTLALMLGLATRWHDYHADVRAGDWSRSPTFCLMHRPVVELAGKTLGIVGYGSLGQAVARLAEAFGMRVKVAASLRPGADSDADTGRVPLRTLLPDVDVLSLHCPLTEDTRHLIGASQLAAMKPTAFLINTARGALIDEPALADALRRGEIAGAALDVLGQEPPPADHVLLAPDIPNLIITPHNAWISRECRQRLLDGVANNVRDWVCASSAAEE